MKDRKKWRVGIYNKSLKKREHLGCFENEEDAAKLFDVRAKELMYGKLNFGSFLGKRKKEAVADEDGIEIVEMIKIIESSASESSSGSDGTF